MRRGVGLWGLLLLVSVAACSPITVRQARRWEEGLPVEVDSTAVVVADTLARDAETLPAPRNAVVAAALQLLGTPESALDCSALVVRAWAAGGVALPRTVREQLGVGTAVAGDSLLPGDLVFFTFSRRPADHVALYVGRGQIVHVSSAAGGVALSPLAAPPFSTARVAVRRIEPAPAAGRGV